jgi:hypothetical protein
VHLEIAEDAGLGWVGGANLGLALDGEGLVLVEVGGGFDVRGDDAVAQAEAIDLDGQQDRKTAFLESIGEMQRGTAAEALANEDEPGLRGLRGLELTVGITVEGAQDEPVGHFGAAVSQGLSVDTGGVTKAEHELPNAAVVIVPAFEATEEAEDQDIAWREGRRNAEVAEFLGSE